MASASRFVSFLRLAWRWLRVPAWLGLGLVAGFLGPYLWVLDGRVQQRFGELTLSVPTRVFARPLALAPGVPMNGEALRIELEAAGYQGVEDARVPGSWSRSGNIWLIASRGFVDPQGGELPRRVRVTLAGGAVGTLTDVTSGKPLRQVRLDPARIATLYGTSQEERELVTLAEVPPLLVAGLQAVEDRDFNHHHGIDFGAIARATLANLRAGKVVQGGSTLTQQLVRNLFLDRNRSMVRKLNEAALAGLIETHYDKGRILDAYVNEVFLGQRGNQAVHGFAAASQFYFGRRLRYLRTPEIALLVGMVQGPSYYDPRRYPQRALQRRNLVLRAFEDTGLIDAAARAQAQAAPLGVTTQPQLPQDRFPAFMQLVRAQIAADFDEATLREGGLDVFTTLDPAAQILAERALGKALGDLGKRGEGMEGAVVVTDVADGGVLAVVGGRDPGAPGFNRALDARRPIGSLVKPFVYLVALADPAHWSLASLLDDAPVNMRLPNGSVWTPENDDHQVHGRVLLVDALVRSWNLATVHLGMQLGVGRVAGLLRSLGIGRPIAANPSLLLGAVDLSPLEVAQMYQFLAADGHALPLISLRGVLGKDGKALKHYAVKPGAGEYRDPIRLLTYAMQQVTRSGTARALGASDLARLNAAGKTGTSDSQRDSWFAGFTGSHLAVAWVGRDDNKPTGLFGATGGLRVWMELFRQLPTRALPQTPAEGVEYAWINPVDGLRSTPECPGARRLPFAAGHPPAGSGDCLQLRFQDIFNDDSNPSVP